MYQDLIHKHMQQIDMQMSYQHIELVVPSVKMQRQCCCHYLQAQLKLSLPDNKAGL